MSLDAEREAEAAVASEESRRNSSHRQSGSLLQFVIKACVIAVIVSASAIFVINSVVDKVRDVFANSTGRPFWTKVERELDHAAAPESDLPPEQKEKLLHDIHVIVARWRPFLDAVSSELQKPVSPAPNAN
jgi:hypothetical protein